jgi:hypothetical protein
MKKGKLTEAKSLLLKTIAEKVLSENTYTDIEQTKSVLMEILSYLKFETTISDIKTTNNITFLQIYYKSDELKDFDRVIDVTVA